MGEACKQPLLAANSAPRTLSFHLPRLALHAKSLVSTRPHTLYGGCPAAALSKCFAGGGGSEHNVQSSTRRQPHRSVSAGATQDLKCHFIEKPTLLATCRTLACVFLWFPPISILLPPRMCRPRSVNWLVAGTICIRSVECNPSFSNHIAPHCGLSPSSSCIFSSCYERACFLTRCNRHAHQGASSRIRRECYACAWLKFGSILHGPRQD